MRIELNFAISMGLLLSLLMTRPAEVASDLKPELASLAYFKGSWGCSGRFFNGDRKIAAHMEFHADLEGAWLIRRHDDQPPNRFHSLELWGFDNKKNQFVAWMADNFGGVRLFTSPGWAGDRLLWTGDQIAPDKKAQRFLFEKKSQREFAVTYYVSESTDEWKPIDLLACVRE